MLAMTNSVRHHAWGSVGDIPSLLGIEPDGTPHAELWLGAYEGESSTVRMEGEQRRLCDVISALGASPLPFLAKVLAIGSPLSLQLHPGGGDAVKPELLYALEPCRAMCGFRPAGQVKSLLGDVPALRGLARSVTHRQESLRDVMEALIGSDAELLDAVASALHALPRWADVAGAVDELRASHATDPAALAPVVLEPVDLRPGEAMFCAPGQPHTYLSGVGFEVQTSSDAVVRAGLTDKPVDVARFVAELDVTAGARRVRPRRAGAEDVYDAGVPEFALGVVQAADGALAPIAGPQILLCTAGSFSVEDGTDAARLGRGQAVFVPGPRSRVVVSGSGLLLRVSTGRAG